MNYKVLWIDDDCHTTGKDFIGQAEQDDVDIIAFESHEEGMLYLEQNIDEIQAVILDAKVKHKKDDTVTGLKGLTASRDRLIELNNKFDLPYFIFTGQPDYQSNEIFKQSYGEFYVKGEDDDRIIKNIISRIEQKEDYILKKEYQRVFEVCTEKYIGVDAQKHLLKILSSIRNPNNEFEDELYFTQIRIIIEYTFRSANKFGLLHDACLPNGKVNLSESSLFLAGKDTLHLGVKCTKRHFPNLIADAVQSIVFITGAASHTTDPDIKNNINLLEYRKKIRTPYLLYSLAFQLMDILVWFKEYVDEHSNIEENKKKWFTKNLNSGDCITGIVTRIAENGWGTLLPNSSIKTISIPPKMVEDNNLKEGDTISVITELNDTKTHIKEIKI